LKHLAAPLDRIGSRFRHPALGTRPRFGLLEQSTQLPEQHTGQCAVPLERLDPIQPRQHAPRLLHVATVAALESRCCAGIVPNRKTLAAATGRHT
jgi:hypothetical protein